MTKNRHIFFTYQHDPCRSGGFEYYPVKLQDFRIFFAYIGRNINYCSKVALYELNDDKTNRIELGFMYRIKNILVKESFASKDSFGKAVIQ